ncbi:MAG TPA: hypothetical protein VFN18_02305 [Solirubrobacterales bacterium]|nr:hypothetical protein [Solirubrobacterales bacterium]
MTLRRATEVALGLAMFIAAGLIFYATKGQGFAIDELPYYAHIATEDGIVVHYGSSFSPAYLLAPFNGHLQVGGRFIYEAVFATIGAHYTAFVLINALAICASVGVFFVFARRRIGDLAALAPCLLLLFFGIAREQFLWPFDLHTSLALATGLGGLLSLERGGRNGDVLACLLLVFSTSMIETGLAFVLGAAVMIALGADRLRRAWIVAVPVVFYAIWWVWASKFNQSETELSNVVQLPKTAFNSVAVVLGSLTGTNSVNASTFGTEVTTLGKVLAVAALIGLAVRIFRGGLPRTIWVWLTVAASYWALLAVGDRPPQSTRYLLVSGVLVLLIAADCFRRPLSTRVGAVLVVLALLPLPANIDAMLTGKDENILRTDIAKSRAEFAMLELAGERVDPSLIVSADPLVAEAGGGLYQGIPAGAYLASAEKNGSIAFTLDELGEQPEEIREIADTTLVRAIPVELEPSHSPGAALTCRTTKPGGMGAAVVPLSTGFNLVRVSGAGTPTIGVRRFANSGPGVPIARLRPGGWAALKLPQDGEKDWQLVTKATVTVCS